MKIKVKTIKSHTVYENVEEEYDVPTEPLYILYLLTKP